MKVLINISDDIYNMVINTRTYGQYRFNSTKAIKNGIAFSDNATIADVIKALFGEGEEQVVYSLLGSRRCIEFAPDSVKNTKDAYGFHTMGMIFSEDLWHAPYNGGLISEEHR